MLERAKSNLDAAIDIVYELGTSSFNKPNSADLRIMLEDQKSFPSILSHCSPYNIPKRLLPTENSQLLLLLVVVTTKLLHNIAHFYSDVLYSNLIIIIMKCSCHILNAQNSRSQCISLS